VPPSSSPNHPGSPRCAGVPDVSRGTLLIVPSTGYWTMFNKDIDNTPGTPPTRENDQNDPLLAQLYQDHKPEMYSYLCQSIVDQYFRRPCYVQAVPTYRVQRPGSLAVGEWHQDRDYGHPQGEVSCWLPLTPVEPSSTIHIEEWVPLPRPGEMIIFDAVNLRHGNVINTTGKTRISMDFRFIPVEKLPRWSSTKSINRGLPFIPGGYYTREVVTP
jgi:hypothetical protein